MVGDGAALYHFAVEISKHLDVELRIKLPHKMFLLTVHFHELADPPPNLLLLKGLAVHHHIVLVYPQPRNGAFPAVQVALEVISVLMQQLKLAVGEVLASDESGGGLQQFL